MVNKRNYRRDEDPQRYREQQEDEQEYKPKSSINQESPWNGGFDQADQKNALSKMSKLEKQTRETFEKVQQSKNRTVLGILITAIILLAGCVTIGAVSVALVPWWKHSSEVPEYEWIHIGLWEACYKTNKDGEWSCNAYGNDDKTDSPNSDLQLLQNLSIAGVAIAGFTFFLTIGVVFTRKLKIFRMLLYAIALLCLVSAILLGTIIGLVTDTSKAKEIVPANIQLLTQVTGEVELKLGLVFFLLCGAAGFVFLVLIFVAVLLFIHDDLNLNELEVDDENDENMDEEGFPVKKEQHFNYHGHPVEYMPDARMYPEHKNNHRKQRRHRNQYQQDMLYNNPAFHHPAEFSDERTMAYGGQSNGSICEAAGRSLLKLRKRGPIAVGLTVVLTSDFPILDSVHGQYERPSSSVTSSSRHHGYTRPPRHQHNPQNPPRAQQNSVINSIPETRTSPIEEFDERHQFKDYEDYEMYFNTPY